MRDESTDPIRSTDLFKLEKANIPPETGSSSLVSTVLAASGRDPRCLASHSPQEAPLPVMFCRAAPVHKSMFYNKVEFVRVG